MGLAWSIASFAISQEASGSAAVRSRSGTLVSSRKFSSSLAARPFVKREGECSSRTT
jgi:hypothetical protein